MVTLMLGQHSMPMFCPAWSTPGAILASLWMLWGPQPAVPAGLAALPFASLRQVLQVKASFTYIHAS